ncbi:hypothetical protein DL96DRAFT_1617193 [Flagelloscypha sp. PMI_526]|nr:hypothetical protein DL96DRAFT_1617193 [Flagelloscypha sp. PMI_526]
MKTIKAALNSLPIDLLLRIFSLCNAQTVAKLRQCCQEFREVSHEQIVWLEVLRRTCTDLNLPIPLPQTKHTSTDVELLATTWIRFQLVLKSVKDETPPPRKTVRSINITELVISLQQSPDGRFLFVLHNSGIYVWCLEATVPHLVHTFAMELPSNGWSLLYFATESNNSVIVYLRISSRSQGFLQWVAFRFSFPSHGHANTRLDFLSRLNLLPFSATRWSRFSWTSTLLAMYFERQSEGRRCLLWDPVEGTCASWAADANDTARNSVFFIVHGFIVSFDKASQATIVYALPELPPKDTYAPELCAQLNNPALLHIPAQADMLNRQIVINLSWVPSSTNGYAPSDRDKVAMICNAGGGSWFLEQIALQKTDSPSDPFDPFPLQLIRSSSEILDTRPFINIEGISTKAYLYPDKCLLLYAASKDQTQVIFIVNGPTENNDRGNVWHGVLYDSGGSLELDKRTYSLSPFAGRLCVAAADKIEVIDFIDYPYKQHNPTF